MMRDALAPLLADGVIDEVVGRLKSGKEAEVWLVRHGGELAAAKVYKRREARNFHNNAVYREGRSVRNTRTQRAMARGSRFGRAADEDAWKAREADALHALHAGGVRVPKPLMFYEGVLLMELVVDAGGHPAPRLIDAHVPRSTAVSLYLDLRHQIVAMLCCDLVHGDLSPYNVLLGREGPVIIDFPQAVGAAHNNQAERFLRRDVENLRRYFAQHAPELGAAAGDGQEIWRAYARRELTPDFVPAQRRDEPRPPSPPARSREHRPPAGAPREPRHPAAAAHGDTASPGPARDMRTLGGAPIREIHFPAAQPHGARRPNSPPRGSRPQPIPPRDSRPQPTPVRDARPATTPERTHLPAPGAQGRRRRRRRGGRGRGGHASS